MKKRILCLALAAVLSAFASVPVHAAGPVDGGTVQFTDKGMQSRFRDSGELQQELGKLLPGGSITVRVNLENLRGRSADWYMSSQVVRSLEESSDTANGGVYSYELTYTNDDTGEELTLYSSRNIGGGTSREGLLETNEALEDFLYLDRLGKEETGHISLTIAMDAETLGNAYQGTLADLQMVFAAETVTGGGSGSGGGSGKSPGGPGNAPVSSVFSLGGVQTGDASHLMLWSLAALLSGLILLVWGIIVYKKERGGRRS